MATINSSIINLDDYRAPGAKVYTGRDRGKQVREDSHLDQVEESSDEVTIIIPDNVYSIIPSFFEELFLHSVLKLGRDRFLNKFKFQSEGGYKYEKPLYEAIDRILRKSTAIG